MIKECNFSFPLGTVEWFGAFFIKYDNGEKLFVEGGHVARLPNGEVQLFNANRNPVLPITGRNFAVITSKWDQVFCSFVAVEKTRVRKKIRAG